MNAQDKPTAADTTPKPTPDVQGEGDYASARRFQADEQRFLKTADVPKLAREAAPKSKEEAAELKKAEDIGRSHRADDQKTDPK